MFRVRREVPFAIPGDLRAWDVTLERGPLAIAADVETVLRDCQSLQRRVALKKRDGNVERVVILVMASKRNGAMLAGDGSSLRDAFPLSTRAVLEALADARDPGADGIVML